MPKGFGSKIYYVKETQRQDMFGTGRSVLLCLLSDDQILIEATSAAGAVDSSIETLRNWMIAEGKDFTNCQKGEIKMQCLTTEHYVEFCSYLARVADNPFASMLLESGMSYGVGKAIKEAHAAGLDYIVMPDGKRVRMDQGGYLSLEDLADALGVSPDEMKAQLESEEFQSFSRNRW